MYVWISRHVVKIMGIIMVKTNSIGCDRSHVLTLVYVIPFVCFFLSQAKKLLHCVL